MKTETALNGTVGIVGTLFAALSQFPSAAELAGYATAGWMFWQLGCAIYDRATRSRSSRTREKQLPLPLRESGD